MKPGLLARRVIALFASSSLKYTHDLSYLPAPTVEHATTRRLCSFHASPIFYDFLLIKLLLIELGDLLLGRARGEQADRNQRDHADDERREDGVAVSDRVGQRPFTESHATVIAVPLSRHATAPCFVARRQKKAAITSGVIAAE